MNMLFAQSAYAGLFLCVASFALATYLRRKSACALINPLLISGALCILFLVLTKVEYRHFQHSAGILTWLLTPATVALAIPLYRKRELVKKHWQVILISIAFGSFCSMVLVWLTAILFRLDHRIYITFLPKSVTTAIGLSLAEELGGIPAVTAVAIIVTGVVGSILYPWVFRKLKITHPIAKGLAAGVSSHAMGTNALLNEDEAAGAVSSVSIVLSGILTVIFMNIFAYFL